PIIGVRLNEAARWIEIFGIQIQPSELAKLSMVLFSAWFLGRAQGSKEAMDKAFWVVLIVTAALAFLIVFENLSTAILLCLFVFLMMVVAGVDWKKLLILFLLVASAAALLLFLLIKIERLDGVPRWETWHNRLVTEQLDVRDEGFKITDENRQVSHAKIAISGGKFLGVLPGNSSQRDFLPQAYSDFIFAIIIEDLGWLGLFGVPFLYLFLLFRALKIAKRCTKSVPMLLVLGSALIISMQAFVNMAVAVNWFPVTGQPLPLISRGGSSGVITCLYFAIILSVSNFATQKPIPEEENLISNETEDPDYEQQEEIEAAD
nr:FtsW/RodA/SpoVE family cell cycle protein [Bacteroidales bacterium]